MEQNNIPPVYNNEQTAMRQPMPQNQQYQQPQQGMQPPEPKKSGGKGLMITTIILSSLTLLAIVGFIIYMIASNDKDDQQANTEKTESSTAIPSQANEAPVMVFSTSSDGFLNIRELPSNQSSIVGVLYTGGDGAKFLGRENKWIRVEYQGRQGYVHSSYAVCSTTKPNVGTAPQQKVYYVVLGSYDNLEYAKSYANSWGGPGDNSLAVYRTIVNGTVKYRVCNYCSYSMSSAKEMAQDVEAYCTQTAWVWPSNGLADCVYATAQPLTP